ncbi:class I SAM-dependent methyltransferase [Azospirillum canadense]|uniref:class I SAM-dependent methyltransferase n=1 Tax=Azospirillum canadense TaxID=403962 RepID=UPI00222709F1|nr:class I SAM-dependent methyltransferase [Azospirillum canadense]MCW2240990.1 SAM-dependent methyltransferase [Azospirillum canadense]
MTVEAEPRFQFGKNWQGYLKNHFDEGRLAIAQNCLLDFLGLPSLEGASFIDIGSGSGIHSFGAWRAGAKRVVSFDYDPDSVAATRLLHQNAGSPSNWTILQGSVLDESFIASLGTFDVVYSWGVLHHTGNMDLALRNALRTMAPDALFYLALYDDAMYVSPGPDYWLDVKRRYNRGSAMRRRLMEAHYIWATLMGRRLSNLGQLIRSYQSYRKERGMSLYVDVKDWLGGWPMEFSDMGDTLDLCCRQNGLSLLNLSTGQANTEYLFGRGARVPSGKDLMETMRVPSSPDQVPSDRPVYLYGMGILGDLLKAEIDQAGLHTVAGYVDRSRRGEIGGKRIMVAEELFAAADRDAPILVASQAFGSILKALHAQGFHNVYNLHPAMVKRYRQRA